jgi:hypothetical protein
MKLLYRLFLSILLLAFNAGWAIASENIPTASGQGDSISKGGYSATHSANHLHNSYAMSQTDQFEVARVTSGVRRRAYTNSYFFYDFRDHGRNRIRYDIIILGMNRKAGSGIAL